MKPLIFFFLSLNLLFGQSSTWETIQDSIWTPQCVMCHASGLYFAEQSGLILTEDAAYEELINVTPTNQAAAEDGLELVGTQGISSVYTSFLWEKINANNFEHFYEDHPEYGNLMPLGMDFLSNGKLEFIRQWIIAGAPDTGIVADEALLDDTTFFELPEFEALAVPENGIQFHLGPFDVPPQFERELFYYTELDTPDLLYVNRFETVMAPGSHHFIIYTYDDDLPFSLPTPGVFRELRYGNGSYNPSVLLYMLYQKFVTGTQTRFFNYTLPEGVALEIDPAYGFDLNSHYANYTNDTLTGEIYNNYYFVDSSEVEHIGKILQLNNNDIELPAGSETTLNKTFWVSQTFGTAISIFQLMSHSHKHNTSFKVYRRTAGDSDYRELVYLALDWEHPPIIEYDPPMVFYDGDGIELEATFYNDTDDEINFGLLSTDEMMILFGLYFEGVSLETDQDVVLAPTQFKIESVYPNPFNPSTTIRFHVPVGARTISPLQLNIYDITGRFVETLAKERMEPGIHEIQWNASNHPSGIYFVRLNSGHAGVTQKIVLVK